MPKNAYPIPVNLLPDIRTTVDGKIAEVALGTTDVELDTNTLNRIQDIDKLNQKDKELIFEFLDSFISNRKIKKALT